MNRWRVSEHYTGWKLVRAFEVDQTSALTGIGVRGHGEIKQLVRVSIDYTDRFPNQREAVATARRLVGEQ